MYFIQIQTAEGWRSTNIFSGELGDILSDAQRMSAHGLLSTRVVEVHDGEEHILQEIHISYLPFDFSDEFLEDEEAAELVNWQKEGF